MIEFASSAARGLTGARAFVLDALGLTGAEWTAELPQSMRLRSEYATIFEADLREGSSKLVRAVYRRSHSA